eukprot:339530-Rhodomonas_salina.1
MPVVSSKRTHEPENGRGEREKPESQHRVGRQAESQEPLPVPARGCDWLCAHFSATSLRSKLTAHALAPVY